MTGRFAVPDSPMLLANSPLAWPLHKKNAAYSIILRKIMPSLTFKVTGNADSNAS
ncbi:MAG: hypothetical protein ACJ70R_06195 [Nitrososphaera sp.]